MASIIKLIKTLRNHWKKTTFAACAITYGANYAKQSYEIQQMMESYCKEAQKYGLQPLSPTENPRRVLVILNPTANRRKAVKQFEQYCVPILHLAGICVDVVQTKNEGHARTIIEEYKEKSDAIIIAGGDGTISESITGLLRRPDNSILLESCSIGVLPLGRMNSFAQQLFSNENTNKTLNYVQRLADASMAIVREQTKRTDVMKIEIMSEEDDKTNLIATTNKPVYALSSIQWGSYRDARAKQDKYWYFGSLRKYITYVFNGYKTNLNWNCTANVLYSPPCEGCSNCFQDVAFLSKTENHSNNHNHQMGRWWSSFVPKPGPNTKQDVQDNSLKYKQQNDDCTNVQSKRISTTDFNLFVANKRYETEHVTIPHLMLNLGTEAANVSYLDFIKQGWRTESEHQRDVNETIQARQIELTPIMNNEQLHYYSIDNEDFEVKPIRITLLPKIIKVFC